jgi:hypothetical protein
MQLRVERPDGTEAFVPLRSGPYDLAALTWLPIEPVDEWAGAELPAWELNLVLAGRRLRRALSGLDARVKSR